MFPQVLLGVGWGGVVVVVVVVVVVSMGAPHKVDYSNL